MAAAAPAEEGEDPRLRRSNTDCVFFLVSNFACNKGSKCEYRHCKGARFNPTNCWYWFHGNCVNPSCTFRHPPLENLNRTKSLADQPSLCGSASVKTANPCYFYHNSCCTKGDHCPFLHEPPTPKNVVGVSSEATTFNPAVNENSVGDEMVEVSKDAHANPCQGNSYHLKTCHSKEVPELSNPEFGEAIPIAPETSVVTGEYMKCSTLSYQTSGDSTMEHSEQDDCRDSSPGFDVLVDDGGLNKNDLGLQLARKRDVQVLHAKYDIGVPNCYDQDYYDSLYYGQAFGGFDGQDGYFYLGDLEGVQEHDIGTTLGHIPSNRVKLVGSASDEYDKRFLKPRNFTSSTEDVAFAREHTKTRYTSKRRRENRKGTKGRKGRRKRRCGLEPVVSSQEIESRSSHRKQDSLMEECPQPIVCATFRGLKKGSRGKQRHVLSARDSEHPRTDFTGPKTLSQIKEEKCISKSSFSPSAARMPHERSFSYDF
ncbi:hypothetical protein BRADI_2g34167v3 [Brachypodium distachyon]|uniref:C3H1-type domain-containing protein n=2 Tax=Brachypodium distachyon TaxID=15368 RepID=I1HLB5_BRADI|nr:hypothetical protein BRADI_2g34167v3 [Brachypodium distachyon]